MDAFAKMKNKRTIMGGIILIVLVFGILTFIQIQTAKKTLTQATQAVTTSKVRLGDISVEIAGTGSVVAPDAIDLAFSTSGKVAELNVNPGKSVIKGDVLAKLDRITSLKIDVDNAKLAFSKAQKALDDLEANKEITLANALLAQSNAAAALEKAQNGEVNQHTGRCEKNVTEQYYYDYMYARADYLYWAKFLEGGSGYGEMYIRQNMAPFALKMRNNYSNWKYCEGYSELEINQSVAAVEKAQSDFDKAKAKYEAIKNNNGIDPDELALAQTAQKNAELQYAEAQRILDGATLTSPMDGTVLTVGAAVGESINPATTDETVTYKSSFIKIADLSQPVVQASFDETDLSILNKTCTVQTSFASLPKETFKGTITQINPSLVTTDSVTTAQAFISIIDPKITDKMKFPIGLGATIDLTCNIAQNTLLVPLQALKQESAGKASVYVINSDGKTEAHTVEVGAKSTTSAEIKGDLKVGDVVITSTVK